LDQLSKTKNGAEIFQKSLRAVYAFTQPTLAPNDFLQVPSCKAFLTHTLQYESKAYLKWLCFMTNKHLPEFKGLASRHTQKQPVPQTVLSILNAKMNDVQPTDIWFQLLCSAAHLSTRHHDGSSMNILWWKQHIITWVNKPPKEESPNFKMKPKLSLIISYF
jgi:hypothetical protein